MYVVFGVLHAFPLDIIFKYHRNLLGGKFRLFEGGEYIIHIVAVSHTDTLTQTYIWFSVLGIPVRVLRIVVHVLLYVLVRVFVPFPGLFHGFFAVLPLLVDGLDEVGGQFDVAIRFGVARPRLEVQFALLRGQFGQLLVAELGVRQPQQIGHRTHIVFQLNDRIGPVDLVTARQSAPAGHEPLCLLLVLALFDLVLLDLDALFHIECARFLLYLCQSRLLHKPLTNFMITASIARPIIALITSLITNRLTVRLGILGSFIPHSPAFSLWSDTPSSMPSTR